MENSELCLDSRKHWMRMIECIKWLKESKLIDNAIFRNNGLVFHFLFGESWGGSDCPLCQVFGSKKYACLGCPLYEVSGICGCMGTPYKAVIEARTTEKWLEAAEYKMIPALEKAYQYCLREENNEKTRMDENRFKK